MIEQFDILAISEHCLFQEQLGMLKLSCDNTYNCTAATADDNPPILSGKAAHGGVVLLWKVAIDDYVSPWITSNQTVLSDFNVISLVMNYYLLQVFTCLRLVITLKNTVSISIIFGHYTIPCLQVVKSFSWTTSVVI